MMRRMRPAAQPPADPTSSRILDVAERLVQTRGFNGFSYADIALEVGITKASLHYHFATKAELGRRLIARYSEQFSQALRGISERLPAAPARLRAYVKLYTDVLSDERMCLCGMLAAEYSTLPAAMQSALRTFFELNEAWLADLLEAGLHDGTLSVSGRSADAARMLVGALEGEMLVARAYDDPARFIAAAELLVAPLDADRARVRSSPRARAARGAPRRLRSPRPARSARAGPRP
jgi:TetR/AcrR family transcriptional repressor of nem operon